MGFLKGMARSCKRRANHYATKSIYTAIGGDSSTRNMYGNHAAKSSAENGLPSGRNVKKIYCETDMKFYASAAEVEKESDGLYKAPGVRNACKNNKLYKGKAWKYVD